MPLIEPQTDMTATCSELSRGGGIVLTHRGRTSFVYAASSASTTVTAFAIRHGSGLLRVVLPFDRTQELAIPSMDTSFVTAERMCVSVDAIADVTTGISAADRARTARVLGSSTSSASELTRPGHVIVVAVNPDARPTTISEHALTLVAEAGLGHAAVVTDLVGISDPTGMMTKSESQIFAKNFGHGRIDL